MSPSRTTPRAVAAHTRVGLWTLMPRTSSNMIMVGAVANWMLKVAPILRTAGRAGRQKSARPRRSSRTLILSCPRRPWVHRPVWNLVSRDGPCTLTVSCGLFEHFWRLRAEAPLKILEILMVTLFGAWIRGVYYGGWAKDKLFGILKILVYFGLEKINNLN